jgi:hypothetical protein
VLRGRLALVFLSSEGSSLTFTLPLTVRQLYFQLGNSIAESIDFLKSLAQARPEFLIARIFHVLKFSAAISVPLALRKTITTYHWSALGVAG